MTLQAAKKRSGHRGRCALPLGALCLSLLLAWPAAGFARSGGGFHAPGREHAGRMPFGRGNPGERHGGGRPEGRGRNQPHLGAWLRHHQDMTPDQRQQALEREPGFNRLPQETQQRLINRMRQIDNMPPRQRQRTLDRIEAMERLSPERRQAVRASVQELKQLPPDRENLVRKAFRDLREYPPEQRKAIMAAPQFQSQFTPRERGILGNILAVEPYEPRPSQGVPPMQDGK